MPTLYWIGGGADKNWSTVANWSTASGGPTTASAAPTASDDVHFTGEGATGNTDSLVNTNFNFRRLIISSSYTAALSCSADLISINGIVEFNSSSFVSSSVNNSLVMSASINTTVTLRPNDVSQWPGRLLFTNANNSSNSTYNLSGSLITRGPFAWNGRTTFNSVSGSYVISYGGIKPSGSYYISGTGGVVWAGGTYYTANNLNCTWGLQDLFISGSVEAMGRMVNGSGGGTTPTLTWITGSISASKGGDTYGPEWQGRGGTCRLNTGPMPIWNLTSAATHTYVIVSSYASASSIGGSGTMTIDGLTGTEYIITPSVATYTNSVVFSGSAKFVVAGPPYNAIPFYIGTTAPVGIGSIRNDIDLVGSGSINPNSTFVYGGKSLNYIPLAGRGGVNTSGSTFCLNGATSNTSCSLNVAGITWNDVLFTGSAQTVHLSASLFVSRSLSVGVNTTFTGSNSWSCSTLTSPSITTNTLTLQNGINYTARDAITLNTTRVGSIFVVTSNSATVRSGLILPPTKPCNVMANFTRIDASGGRPIRTWNGTVTDCINVEPITDLLPAVSSFISSF